MTTKTITRADITNLIVNTTINVTTNSSGSGQLRKLRKIQDILKKSAESQLLVAAYYNKLILDGETNSNLYADTVDYTRDLVYVNNIVLTPETDIDDINTVPLVSSYKEKIARIETVIRDNITTGGIIDDGNTYDGGRPLPLKSKKKKKTSAKRR